MPLFHWGQHQPFCSTQSQVDVSVKHVLAWKREEGKRKEKKKRLRVHPAQLSILPGTGRPVLKSWDHASGQICVHEAGGVVTDFLGMDLELASKSSDLTPGIKNIIKCGVSLYYFELFQMNTYIHVLEMSSEERQKEGGGMF